MLKAVLFDVDGTLLDTTEFIMGAFEYALKTHGVPAIARHEISKLVGGPVLHIYKTLVPDHEPEVLYETHVEYQMANLHGIKAFPHVITTLRKIKHLRLEGRDVFFPHEKSSPQLSTLQKSRLRSLEIKSVGIKVGAITNRTKRTSMKSLELTRLAKYIDLVLSKEDVVNHKPHPEPVIKSLKYFKVKPEEAIIVGDAIPDIEAGKNAGVKTIGVTYGFGKEVIGMANPDYLVDDFAEILPIITSFRK